MMDFIKTAERWLTEAHTALAEARAQDQKQKYGPSDAQIQAMAAVSSAAIELANARTARLHVELSENRREQERSNSRAVEGAAWAALGDLLSLAQDGHRAMGQPGRFLSDTYPGLVRLLETLETLRRQKNNLECSCKHRGRYHGLHDDGCPSSLGYGGELSP